MSTQTHVEELNSFGYWLRRQRKALDWTQAELARRVHCTAAMIRKIEADERKPSRQLAEQLADQLHISSTHRAEFLQAARQMKSPDRLSPTVLDSIDLRLPNNLPAPLTSLIDRTRDIAAVVTLLTRKDVRLLTLIGPPGIGKTRLCIQSAENVLAHFHDGVWFVDLAPIAEPALVLPTIARTLNIGESGEMTPFQQLVALFKDKRILLALDNFEQVANAAQDVADLLKACKQLKVLTTSRVPLYVYGENEYAVPSMALPPRHSVPNKLIEYESVQLFLARVRGHHPDYGVTPANVSHIADVCIRLDGVPLALELAAASLRRMSLEQLAMALNDANWLSSLRTPARDLPPRQRTLYHAIAWSYNLLDATTQAIFRRLGVLAGRFDAEAATAISALDDAQIESGLATLTDHSLLVREPERWRMLEMIREFALEQMDTDERAAAQQRHAFYFAARLHAIASEDVSHIELNLDNYRAALRWAIHTHDELLAVTMGTELADFWEAHGYLREGLGLTREVLAIAENVEPHLRMSFLSNAAHLAWQRHEFDAALDLIEQGIALARASGLGNQLAGMFNVLARIFIEQGDYVRAEQSLHDCMELAQKIQDVDLVARGMMQQGEVALACGRLDEARATIEQSLALSGNLPSRFIAMAHTNLAEVALARGDHTLARDELQLALPYIHSHTRRWLCFLTTLAGWLIATPRAHYDDVRHGVELFGAVAGLTERTGAPLSAMYRALNETRIEIARRRLTARAWDEAWQHGHGMTTLQVIDYVSKIVQTE